MPSWVGQQLGNYRLIRLLGKGGFGQVYLSEHIYLKTQAAIKLVLEDVSGAQADVFRTEFLQEAQRIASLKHPHILRVLDFGMETSTPYLVIEYAVHGTLLERHPRGTRVSMEQVVRYTRQIAQALYYAHEVGLIHRDVKPANVLLDERDTVLLSDFGIATIVHHTSSMQTGAYAGTAAYMAPEQLQGKPVPASDQYALAIMVYEWLCGQLPYQGDPIAVGMQHLVAPIPSLRLHNGTLSPNIEAVVHQALAKDPRQRFATVLSFANALEQAHQETHSSPSTFSITPSIQVRSVGQLQGEGEVFYAQEQYEEALTAFKEILQIDPENAYAHGWIGATFYHLKQYEEAFAEREKAIQKGSAGKKNYQGKGEALYQLKRYEEAIVAFDQAREIDPDYVMPCAWKAGALYYLKKYEEALEAANQAIQIDPGYAWPYGWKGASLYQLKQYEEALIAREQAIRKGSSNKENYQGKGEALYQLKRYEEAIVAFDQAIQIDRSYTTAYTWKAKALSQQRKSKQTY